MKVRGSGRDPVWEEKTLATAAARLFTSSFSKMARKWRLTVFGEMISVWAMALLLNQLL
jgi:hypothetical protein